MRTTTVAAPVMDGKANPAMYMTLRELRRRIRSTKGKKLPTWKQLRESEEPLESYRSKVQPDYCLAVYQSGFAVALSGKKYTVIRIDEACRDYSYECESEAGATPKDFEDEFFLDQPWTLRIMMVADDRLQGNEDTREGHWVSRHPEIPDDKNWMRGGVESFENTLIAKLDFEAALDVLTEKQREAVELYRMGYTQKEIAGIAGISLSALKDRLYGAIKKLRNELSLQN